MKKLPFFLFFFLLLAVQLPAQTHRQALKQGHGARTVQEIGQAVFTALKDNRFQNLYNYFPDEVELRVLRRRSSEDMQLLLDRSSADTLRQTFQRNFNTVTQQATARTFSWTDWEMADATATRRDPKNPLLYTIKLKLANAAGAEEMLGFEAIKVRGRFFLFKQLVFNPAAEAGARN